MCTDHGDILCAHACVLTSAQECITEGSGGLGFGIQALDRSRFILLQLCGVGQGLKTTLLESSVV